MGILKNIKNIFKKAKEVEIFVDEYCKNRDYLSEEEIDNIDTQEILDKVSRDALDSIDSLLNRLYDKLEQGTDDVNTKQ